MHECHHLFTSHFLSPWNVPQTECAPRVAQCKEWYAHVLEWPSCTKFRYLILTSYREYYTEGYKGYTLGSLCTTKGFPKKKMAFHRVHCVHPAPEMHGPEFIPGQWMTDMKSLHVYMWNHVNSCNYIIKKYTPGLVSLMALQAWVCRPDPFLGYVHLCLSFPCEEVYWHWVASSDRGQMDQLHQLQKTGYPGVNQKQTQLVRSNYWSNEIQCTWCE